jgi:hypothetical protein
LGAPVWRTSRRSGAAGESSSCVQVALVDRRDADRVSNGAVTRVDLRKTDLSGMQVYLRGTERVAALLARLVAPYNVVEWENHDPFQQVVALVGPQDEITAQIMRFGTAAALESHVGRMLSEDGLPIRLPASTDGTPQQITVLLHAVAERTATGFARERVDASYEVRYRRAGGEQVERSRTIPGGVGLLETSSAATTTPPITPGEPRWFGKLVPEAEDSAASGGPGFVDGRGRQTTNSGVREAVRPIPAGRSLAELERLIRDVESYRGDLSENVVQRCLMLVAEWIRQSHPEGLTTSTDDLVPGSPAALGYLNLPPSQWPEATTWSELVDQVPVGGMTVVYGRPGGKSHAVVLVDSAVGVRIFDPRAKGELKITPIPDNPDDRRNGMPP